MQMHNLETLYHQFQSALQAFPDTSNSLCLYESTNGEYFRMYPSPNFVLPTSSTLANVLPDLKTRFCVQATGAIFQAAIDSAIMMLHHEVEFGCGYSVRIVDNAAQLPSVAPYYQSAFVRDDRCLVVWGNCVDVMTCWNEVCLLLQSRFGSVPLHSNPMVGLSYGDNLSMNLFNFHNAPPAESSTQQSNNALSFLNELSFLETVHGPTTPSPSLDSANYGAYPLPDSAWLLDQSESPGMGVLGLGVQTLNTSDSSHATDVPSHGFGNTPLTLNLASISPPPIGVYDLFQDDPVTTTASSLGFSTSASDGAVSPASFFSWSPAAQQNTFSTDAPGPLSFRRHSFGVAGTTPAPRTVGMKTRRGGDNDGDYSFTVVDDASAHFLTAGTHTSKRRRPAAAADGGEPIVKATSAPALFTVPLPSVEHAAHEQTECDDDDGSSSVSGQSFALTTPLSASSSLFPSPSPAPAPTPASTSTSPPAPAPASRRARRRAGTSGGARRAPRTPCRYCPRTFTRAQDAQRHESRSCPQNPNKEGESCPECGEVLSRTDSMQRHWRGHKDPQCEPPSWANMRA